jgi:hypothetical protein
MDALDQIAASDNYGLKLAGNSKIAQDLKGFGDLPDEALQGDPARHDST